MTAPVRLVTSALAFAAIAALYVLVDRAAFGFDPLDPVAWRGALDAFTGVRGFDPFDSGSWGMAVSLASRPGPERFLRSWILDEPRELLWLAWNSLLPATAAVAFLFRAPGVLGDLAAATRRTETVRARATAPTRGPAPAPSTPPPAPPGAEPGDPSSGHPPADSSPSPAGAAGGEEERAAGGEEERAAGGEGARAPDAPSGSLPAPSGGAPDSGAADRGTADADTVSREIDGEAGQFPTLVPLAEVRDVELVLDQLQRAVQRSNTVEQWPAIALPGVDAAPPPNCVLAAGDSTLVMVLGDRPGNDLEHWSLVLADWLGDQLEVAAVEFSDSFNPLTPKPVLVLRELGMSAGTRPAHVAVARLEAFCAGFSRANGPVHPALRDLLDDVFGTV